jgi:hypothetical protein
LMFIKYEDLICVSTVWMTPNLSPSRRHKTYPVPQTP